MRNITSESIDAFLGEKNYKNGNTRVINTGVTVELRLHGSMIAYKMLGSTVIHIQNCGYKTNVTKERLNGFPLFPFNKRDIFGI